jgi:plasmid stabilization system protein ParE
MSRNIVWSATAIDDFEAAIGFLAERNPHAALRVATAIDEAVRKLGGMPTGRPGRVAGIYEKPVPGTPYVVAYASAPETATLAILRIIHMARDWPEGSWPDA